MNSSHSDEELVRSVATGDDQALINLYQRHGRSVYSLACYIIQDRALAEEITQDVFVVLWQKANQFDGARGRLDSWLLQITRNLAIDRLRYRRRRVQDTVSLESAEADPAMSQGPINDDGKRELNVLLQKLPEAQRQAIELAYFQGFTHDEIAARFGLPVGTVKSRILLGLRKLQTMMK
jgi:RNA polymerase sigma-70 factor, ECF subfamily